MKEDLKVGFIISIAALIAALLPIVRILFSILPSYLNLNNSVSNLQKNFDFLLLSALLFLLILCIVLFSFYFIGKHWARYCIGMYFLVSAISSSLFRSNDVFLYLIVVTQLVFWYFFSLDGRIKNFVNTRE